MSIKSKEIIVKFYQSKEFPCSEEGVLKCPFGGGNIIFGNKYTDDNVLFCMMNTEDYGEEEYGDYEDCNCFGVGWLSDDYVILHDYNESPNEFKEFNIGDYEFKEYRKYKLLRIEEVAVSIEGYSEVKLNDEDVLEIYKIQRSLQHSFDDEKLKMMIEKYNIKNNEIKNDELLFNISENFKGYNLSDSFAFGCYEECTYFRTEDREIRYFGAD